MADSFIERQKFSGKIVSQAQLKVDNILKDDS